MRNTANITALSQRSGVAIFCRCFKFDQLWSLPSLLYLHKLQSCPESKMKITVQSSTETYLRHKWPCEHFSEMRYVIQVHWKFTWGRAVKRKRARSKIRLQVNMTRKEIIDRQYCTRGYMLKHLTCTLNNTGRRRVLNSLTTMSVPLPETKQQILPTNSIRKQHIQCREQLGERLVCSNSDQSSKMLCKPRQRVINLWHFQLKKRSKNSGRRIYPHMWLRNNDS